MTMSSCAWACSGVREHNVTDECAQQVIDDCEFLCVGVLGRVRTCPGMCICLCVRITWSMTLSDVCGWYVCVYGYEYVCVLVIVHGRYCQLSACVLVSEVLSHARYCHTTDQHSCVPTVCARACMLMCVCTDENVCVRLQAHTAVILL